MIGPLFSLALALERPQCSQCSTRWRPKPHRAKFGGCTEHATETTTRLPRSRAALCKRCRTAAVEYCTAGRGPTIVWIWNLTLLDASAYPCSTNLVCLA